MAEYDPKKVGDQSPYCYTGSESKTKTIQISVGFAIFLVGLIFFSLEIDWTNPVDNVTFFVLFVICVFFAVFFLGSFVILYLRSCKKMIEKGKLNQKGLPVKQK